MVFSTILLHCYSHMCVHIEKCVWGDCLASAYVRQGMYCVWKVEMLLQEFWLKLFFHDPSNIHNPARPLWLMPAQTCTFVDCFGLMIKNTWGVYTHNAYASSYCTVCPQTNCALIRARVYVLAQWSTLHELHVYSYTVRCLAISCKCVPWFRSRGFFAFPAGKMAVWLQLNGRLVCPYYVVEIILEVLSRPGNLFYLILISDQLAVCCCDTSIQGS